VNIKSSKFFCRQATTKARVPFVLRWPARLKSQNYSFPIISFALSAGLPVMILAFGLSPTARAADVIKADNTTSLVTGSSWVGGAVPSSTQTAVWDSTVTAANSVAVGAGTPNWLGIRIADPGGPVTITGNNKEIKLGSGGIDMSAATQDFTFNWGVTGGTTNTLSANQTWKITAGRTLTVTNTLARISGVYSLAKSGSGTLALVNGANDFSGGFTINAGTTVLGSATALGTGTVTITGGTLDSSVSGLALTANNAQNWNGNFTFAGTESLDLGAGTVSLNTSPVVTVSANTLTAGGVISGLGYGLTKAGNGTLALNGANTFSGTMTISNGVVALGAGGSLATNTSVSISAGATFDTTAKASYTLGASASLTASGTGTGAGSTAATIAGGTGVNLGSRPITLMFTPTTFLSDTSHPSLYIANGSLTLNGAITVINTGASPLGPGTYTLIKQASGTITGAPTLGVVTGLAPNTMPTIVNNGSEVRLVVTGAGATSVTLTLTRHSGTGSSMVYGDTLQFDATAAPSGATGTVTLFDGAALIGSAALSGGSCTISPAVGALKPGVHTNLVAHYGGDATYLPTNSAALSPQTVAQKGLTISGAVANNKCYDGTTAAAISGTLAGIVGADSVSLNGTGTFGTVGPATGIAVTSTSTLGGPDAANYTLASQPVGLSANIYASAVWAVAGGGAWGTPGNWVNNVLPNAANTLVDFSAVNIADDTLVTLSSPVTVGKLVFGDTDINTPGNWLVQDGSNPANTLALISSSPSITVYAGASATLDVDTTSSAGLTKLGGGSLTLAGTTTYSGATAVNEGALILSSLWNSAGSLTVSNGATLGVQPVALGATLGMSSLTLGSSVGGFVTNAILFGDLADPTLPVETITNGLDVNATVVLNLTGTALMAGLKFPLIKYGTLTGAGSFKLGPLPNGFSGVLTTNLTTKTIELTLSGGPVASQFRPNVLLIFPDQWRGCGLSFGPNHDADVRTPNLERLASQGIRFDRCYATFPLCTPNRAVLTTGRYPTQTGMVKNDLMLPPDFPCMADVFRDAGYATYYCGKLHIDGGATPGFVPKSPTDWRRRGYTKFEGFNSGHAYFENSQILTDDGLVMSVPTNNPNGDFDQKYLANFESHREADLTAAFIRTNANRPWMIQLCWGPPHQDNSTGYTPPAVFDTYVGASLTLRLNNPNLARGSIAGSYGLREALDYEVGRLMQLLDDLGLASRTLVVFTSDHGDMLGSHSVTADPKNQPEDESLRVPLIMRLPGKIPAGTNSDFMICTMDLMPTLVRLAGLQIPAGTTGKDKSTVALGGTMPETPVFGMGANGGGWRSVVKRSGGKLYKLAMYTNGLPVLQSTKLWNIDDDPYELTNLVNQTAYTVIQTNWEQEILNWQQVVNDPWPAQTPVSALAMYSDTPSTVLPVSINLQNQADGTWLARVPSQSRVWFNLQQSTAIPSAGWTNVGATKSGNGNVLDFPLPVGAAPAGYFRMMQTW
jgi:autotransporter-associated beta strand protein